MAKIIDGKVLAEQIKDKVAKEIYELKGPRPNLAIILVGEREDSVSYVNLKEKEAKKVGIDTHVYRCDKNISEIEIFDMIDYLNKDETVDAILIQLPLPVGFDTDGIILAMDPEKDVDRFHPKNLEFLLSSCKHDDVTPPLVKVVLEIFKSIGCDIRDRKICTITNSDVLGLSFKKVLECLGGKVKTTHVDDDNLVNETKAADILITAVGKPHFIKKEMIKNDAIVIDIGTTKKDKKVCGDVDFEDVKDRASYITPVPGGVGPMTIAMLFQNTLEIFKKRHN